MMMATKEEKKKKTKKKKEKIPLCIDPAVRRAPGTERERAVLVGSGVEQEETVPSHGNKSIT